LGGTTEAVVDTTRPVVEITLPNGNDTPLGGEITPPLGGDPETVGGPDAVGPDLQHVIRTTPHVGAVTPPVVFASPTGSTPGPGTGPTGPLDPAAPLAVGARAAALGAAPASPPVDPALPDGGLPVLEEALGAASVPQGPFVYEVAGDPDRVRLTWRYADDDDAEWSDSLRCDRPCSFEVPEARAVEVRVRKSDYCTETFELEPDPAHGPWELELNQGCFERNTICFDTCPYANDRECDDGGPNSLYAVCAFGTDCADCGPRRLGR
jgi:hypothetical protein